MTLLFVLSSSNFVINNIFEGMHIICAFQNALTPMDRAVLVDPPCTPRCL